MRRKTDPSYSRYSQASSTTYQAAVAVEAGAKTAFTEANDVADEGSVAVRAARELRISHAHTIWQSAEARLERLTNAHNIHLAPPQILILS